MSTQQLAILGGPKTIHTEGPHYTWPRITESLEQATIKQLHSTISIYDRSGVIEEFETLFADYHKRKYAVLSNSGTNAIYSMFEGIGLGPGDEVICPVYTFFATVSPLLHTGAVPIFCDCGDDGNISPKEIEKHITARTRAVVVTHMWGVPCDMDEIASVCRRHDLRLFEDCSHAHGARCGNRLVGTFGDAAAWSLQGQKTITGGEGGIMLTDSSEVYYRALLQGHYNKRCKQEIPATHPLGTFSVTGFGLKFRAHPLAVAIAKEQFSHLDEWLFNRQTFADRITRSLTPFPFLKPPQVTNKRLSWYAYILQFDERRSNGVSIDLFTRAVMAEGLVECDRPKTTGLLHQMPLFTTPEMALPRLYAVRESEQSQHFPVAMRFYDNAFKLPVWAFPDEEKMVDLYIDGIVKVATIVRDEPQELLLADYFNR